MASLKRLGCLLLTLSSTTWLVHAADEETSTTSDDGVVVLTGTKKLTTERPTPTDTSVTTTITFGSAASPSGSLGTLAANSTAEDASTNTVTLITGTQSKTTSTITSSISGNGTLTSSTTVSAPPAPTNTRPCNNYPEFCNRKYSNITEVGAHNSPFVRAGSAAANQQFPVTDQLNDGVRFLQAQIQWPENATTGPPHLCHTSCDLLDAGPIMDWLTDIRNWVANHPYDVVTILFGNGNYSKAEVYAPYIESTGILQYVYTPPKAPMAVDDWPTLSSMILSGQRVVMFLDYEANQTAYPWLQDQMSNLWETPFDPTDPTFPCLQHRPPGLSKPDAVNRMYLMNHNLNAEVSLLGNSILVPAVSELNKTNAAEGVGSVFWAAENCMNMWDGHAPKILNVDYYNYGSYQGSVFEAAAKINNVTYDKNRPCCGQGVNAAGRVGAEGLKMMVWGLLVGWVAFWVAL
ncbi:PI-PLC X domain-containing protein 1 [Rhypophila decipiens]|uniref:PI-PLC X domain-containing protein 1 n=1 Tax=Rhypophila decipiens TaxID=261697 RepID=A0AAN6YIZ6_9PEZI|nr:PI-PLC X domain-containing protein 1 [Rhypophila decipiens]